MERQRRHNVGKAAIIRGRTLTRSVSIRSVGPQDVPGIARIHACAHRVAMPWLPKLHTREDDLRNFGEAVLASEKVCVADRTGELAGFTAFTPEWIDHLYVDPNHLGQSPGSPLLCRPWICRNRIYRRCG